MTTLNDTPLMYAINGFIYPISAYILIFIAFWGSERLKRKHIILVMCALHAVFVAGFYLIAAVTDTVADRSSLNGLFVIIFNIAHVMGIIVCFKAHIIKNVYVLLTVFLLNTFMNSLSSFVVDWLFPGIVDVWASWQNGLSLLLVNALFMPLFCYLFKKHVSRAILDLANKDIALLCAAPVLFYLLTFSVRATFVGIMHQFPSWLFINFVSIIIVFTNVLMTLSVAKSTRLTIEAVSREQVIAAEKSVMENQLTMQRVQYERMTENAEATKAIRHDLRHHLAAIGQLADKDNAGKVKEYIEGLTGELVSVTDKIYSSNHAINAVVSHYLNIAESEGIVVMSRLKIPQDTGRVPALDLCVILSNFLENALEACRRMEHGEKFINIHSVVDEESISIVVSNSFDGIWKEKDGKYFSRKDESISREGVGISSVNAVCEKHGGLIFVEITGNIWKSSALVNVK